MFTYRAMRHYAPVEAQFATLEEAIQRARSDHETDQACPAEIIDGSGTTVIDSVRMSALLAGHPVSLGWTDNGQQLSVC